MLWGGALVALLVVLCLSTPAALGSGTGACSTLGGTVSKWQDVSNNWSNSGSWDSGVPNSTTTSACITNGTVGTPSVVVLDIDASVEDLQLGSYDTLNLNGGTGLIVNGTQIINAGQINVNAGGGTNSYLFTNNNLTLSGGGTVTLNTTTGGGNAWILQLGAPGGGSYTLTNVDNTIQGEGIIYNNEGTIINEAGGTINANSTGSGVINTLVVYYGTITNAGVLEASNNGQLQLYQDTITNSGVLEATNSGVLQLIGATLDNAGGNITANGAGATVQVMGGTTIYGGTLNTLNGGTLESIAGSGFSTLDGSTASGAIKLSSGSTYLSAGGNNTTVLGTINNQGNFQVNGGGGVDTYLFTSGNTTLQGGGTVTLNTTTGGGNAQILQLGAPGGGGYTLTNVDNTIQGEGIIYNNEGTIINEVGGTINANSTGSGVINTLLIYSGTITNAGLLEATNNGVLQLYENTINNAGGNITANGGTVQLSGGTIIRGGTLSTLNGGILGTTTLAPGGATLDGSTSAGAVTIKGTYTSNIGTDTYLYGSIINNGNIQVNGGGSSGTTHLFVPGSVTLSGGGTVTLNTIAGGADDADAAISLHNGATLTNVNNTIQGEGEFSTGYYSGAGATLINEAGGIINANTTGAPLLSYGGIAYTLAVGLANVTNAGLMEATNNGILAIAGNTVNNAGGTIAAYGPGASVLLVGTTIQGGTLNNNGGAFFGTPAGYTATLDGSTSAGAVTLNGAYTSDYGSTTSLNGAIINNGNILVNGGGGGRVDTYLLTLGNTTLQGGGTVTLNTTTGGGNALLLQLGAPGGGGYTLTNVDNTIQGEGIIYNKEGTIVNEAGGTIIANSTGSGVINMLGIVFGNITNSGILEASNNGVLQLYENTINNAGGNITANGANAAVQVYNSTIQGGTLNTLNGGTMETLGYSALDGSTASGAITLSAGSTYLTAGGNSTGVFGTINNRGNLQVNGGGGVDTYILTFGNTTLQGGGTVTLNTTTGGGNAWILQAAGGSYTLTNADNTIQGEGGINISEALVNEAGGTIIANSTGSAVINTLTIYYGTVTNNGTLQANSGNLLHLYQGSLTNFSGNTLTGGTYNVYGTAASPGTLQIDALGTTGGEIVNNAATILLDGPNSNFVDAAGLDALSGFSNNTAAGSFTIQNGRNFTTSSDFSNAGSVMVGNNSTLTMGPGGTNNFNQSGGSLKVNGAMTVGTATIYGGMVSGSGTITGNVNNVGGTVTASDPGIPDILTINGNYTQGSGGILEAFVEGTGAGQYSQLNITGSATFAGTLDLDFITGFAPTAGETFDLINIGSGNFSGLGIEISGLAPGFQYTEGFANGSFDLTALNNGVSTTPEPSAFLLLAMGIALMILLRKYRNMVRV
jgi:hypothetical protein